MKALRIIAILAGLAALVVAPLSQGNYMIYILCSWLIFTISAMGLNLTLGYAGQVSLAQAAFMGIGAYSTAIITMAGGHWIFGLLAAMSLTFVIGLVLGYPALRVQHHMLAFVTLAFNAIVFLVLRNEDWLTGGSLGIVGIPRPSFGPLDLSRQLPFYYFVLAIFVISAGALAWMLHSPWGRAFKALRENPIRAASLGLDTRRMTLLAFAIGSAFGGLAGALQAPLVQFIEPGSYTLILSLRVLLMVIVGGAGFFFGPMLGAGIVVLLPEFLRFTEGYYLIIYALLVLILMIFSPTGLIGLGKRLMESVKPQTARRDMTQGAQL
ncbi:branched-chain amino acid ABC transporter permease [Notoacmeibacter sp. MSK16QG-6]|uniref:branched-chain amino acid ABC transporter permease n=1 Tax=Notoacmeibacter sp. MSK16QG-6 TaxID=2957982 RepID=UPI0020A10F9B|nr:branched-chain amino acid ABC transporter permease [Notoacmeibacter sp. MSK16QG-6]MCP1198333.1 branched-chain amino acid ABC transporter permease [Notoacmeibacter sp. MSK16QG-6]